MDEDDATARSASTGVAPTCGVFAAGIVTARLRWQRSAGARTGQRSQTWASGLDASRRGLGWVL
jgi:hypothetical protein